LIWKREEDERGYERTFREDADDREEDLRLLERKEDRSLNIDSIVYKQIKEKTRYCEGEKQNDHMKNFMAENN
jgi:hypothetical protein